MARSNYKVRIEDPDGNYIGTWTVRAGSIRRAAVAAVNVFSKHNMECIAIVGHSLAEQKRNVFRVKIEVEDTV